MKRLFAFLCILVLGCLSAGAQPSRTVTGFDAGWRFVQADPSGAEAPGFNDRSWRTLNLPHDWSIEGEFSAENPSTPSGGALPGGVGWYRKHFLVPEGCFEPKPLADKAVRVEFDGVFMNSTV